MHQLLMIAIGYMVSVTIARFGFLSPSLHWLVGLLTLFIVVKWEIRQLALITEAALQRILQQHKEMAQSEDAETKRT